MAIEREDVHEALTRLGDGHTSVEKTMDIVDHYTNTKRRTVASEIAGMVTIIGMFALVGYLAWLIAGTVS